MPPQPAHRLALAALQRLQQDDLIGQYRVDEFYLRLSHILRQYVGWRFGLRAPEQTTEEFLAAVLATEGPLAAHRALLDTVLQHCDLVKFARYRPEPEAMQQAWSSVQAFVEQTADAQRMVTAPQQGALPR